MNAHLPTGLPAPVTETDELDAPYWAGTREGKLRVQRCARLQHLAVGPGVAVPQLPLLRHALGEVEGRGKSGPGSARWHPVHPALKGHGPYIVVLVELPDAGNIRMLGNLLGDPEQPVRIGAPWRRCSSRMTTRRRRTPWCSGSSPPDTPCGGPRGRAACPPWFGRAG